MEYLKEKKSEAQKILFTGLDAAGKTSIILSLQREFSKIATLKPTLGPSRRQFTLMDRVISEWDLGGQMRYRISYLKNPGKFFADTEIAIYVIDIQNTERIPESLSYLSDVIAKFKELKIEPPINVFFHKCDPVLTKGNQNQFVNVIQDLTEKIKMSVKYKEIYFFQTSIYDLYSIIKAMSDILLELYPKSELLQKTIQEFAFKLNCEGLMIIDDNSLILGSYFKDEHSKMLLNETIGYFLKLNDSFLKMGLGQEEDQMLIHKLGKYFLFKQITLDEGPLPFYLLILKGSNPFDLYFIRKEYVTFINFLHEIISK